jgi:hypothetical protein
MAVPIKRVDISRTSAIAKKATVHKKKSPGNAMGKVTVNAIRRAMNNPSMLRAKDNLSHPKPGVRS